MSPVDDGSPAALRAGFPGAGTYTTTLFQPRLTVSIDDGWQVLFDDDDDELALEDDSGDGTLFAASRVSQVVNPKNREVIDAPDDLIAWLRAHPSLVTDPPMSTTIDDRPAMSIDATTGTRPAVDLIAFPGGNFHLPPNVRLRFTVVPMDGPDLLIATGGHTDRFESAIARTGPDARVAPDRRPASAGRARHVFRVMRPRPRRAGLAVPPPPCPP